MNKSLHLFTVSSVLAIVLAAEAAHAQQSPSPEEADNIHLEEILVTARKQSESLMDVPVAVSAIGATELARTGVTDLNRIAQLAPQVIAARSNQGSGASFTIRGIGSSPQDAGIEQSVTLNIDGIQVTRGNIVSQGFFDLQQIEVLKGPQALFFGKNSPAGVISLRSAGPTENFEGYLRGGYEFVANERFIEGAVSGPLSDSLKARLALRATKMDGYLKNVAPGRVSNPFMGGLPTPGAHPRREPDAEELMGRLTVSYDPGGPFDATLKVSAGKYKDSGGASARTQAICPPNQGHPITAGIVGVPQVDTTQTCKLDNIISFGNANPATISNWPGMRSDGQFYTDLWSGLASLTANYNMDGITITSVTGFFKLRSRSAQNAVHVNETSVYGVLGEKTQQFSQELRAVSDLDGALNFTVGGYYETARRRNYSAYLLAYVGADPATGKFHTFESPAFNKGTAISAFGQLRWDISEQLELAGGVRWTHEKKRMHIENTYVHSVLAGPFAQKPVGDVIRGKFRDNDWSPEATLTWRPQPGLMAYVAYKTGYKSGGFSTPANVNVSFNSTNLRFESETVKGAEAGFKAEFAGRTVQIQATAYRYTYKGLQLASFDQPTFAFFVSNAASARVQGFEVSGQWLATPELRFNGSFGYNRARFTDYNGAPCYNGQPSSGPRPCNLATRTQSLKGRPLTRAPDVAFTVGAAYDAEIATGLKIGLNADMTYSGSYYTQEDQHPFAFQDSFARFNAGARVYSHDDRWELALIGRNLTNEYYLETTSNRAFGGSGDLEAQSLRPREVKVQATYRF